MQAKVLGQLRHGVATGGKGRLNRSVAVVWILLNVTLKRQWHWPALGVRNLKTGSPSTRALWALLGHSAHFADEFLVIQVHLPAQVFPHRRQADAFAHVADVALLGSFSVCYPVE